MTDINYIRIVN